MATIKNYELRVRHVRLHEPLGTKILNDNDAIKAAKQLIGDQAQEVFAVFALDNHNRILGYYEVGRGGITYCPIDIRVALRTALILGATNVLAFHNHPSGSVEASKEDLDVTRNLYNAAKTVGLTLLDHIIVSDTDYCSLRATNSRLFKDHETTNRI